MPESGGEIDAWLFDNPYQSVAGYVWWTGTCACPVCGYRCIAIMPIPEGLTDPPCLIECARCGNMTLDPGCGADDDEDDDDDETSPHRE